MVMEIVNVNIIIIIYNYPVLNHWNNYLNLNCIIVNILIINKDYCYLVYYNSIIRLKYYCYYRFELA